jgi:hypothetical protein
MATTTTTTGEEKIFVIQRAPVKKVAAERLDTRFGPYVIGPRQEQQIARGYRPIRWAARLFVVVGLSS